MTDRQDPAIDEPRVTEAAAGRSGIGRDDVLTTSVAMGVAFGLIVGVVLGIVLFDNAGLGIGVGLALGAAFGATGVFAQYGRR